MNIYYEFVGKDDVTVHNNPEDSGNEANQSVENFSYTLEDFGRKGWSFELQDSIDKVVPIQIELGNEALWGDFPTGRGLQLFGTVTKFDEWQTVTFSVGYNTSGDPVDFSLAPTTTGDGNQGFILDPTNVDETNIDYLGMIFNAGHTGTLNPEGWYELPMESNGWSSDNVVTVRDDHNPYYVDNIRIIDADVYDQNPNN